MYETTNKYKNTIEQININTFERIEKDFSQLEIITLQSKWDKLDSEIEFKTIELWDNFRNRAIAKCKIQIKKFGFAFTLDKKDSKDIERMQFIFDILTVCKGDKTLSGLSKKIKPKYETIAKKYPKKINRQEWENLNIHDKKQVIAMIDKLTKNKN